MAKNYFKPTQIAKYAKEKYGLTVSNVLDIIYGRIKTDDAAHGTVTSLKKAIEDLNDTCPHCHHEWDGVPGPLPAPKKGKEQPKGQEDDVVREPTEDDREAAQA